MYIKCLYLANAQLTILYGVDNLNSIYSLCLFYKIKKVLRSSCAKAIHPVNSLRRKIDQIGHDLCKGRLLSLGCQIPGQALSWAPSPGISYIKSLWWLLAKTCLGLWKEGGTLKGRRILPETPAHFDTNRVHSVAHSKSLTVMTGFAKQKKFTHKATQWGGRTALKSASLIMRLRDICGLEKQGGLRHGERWLAVWINEVISDLPRHNQSSCLNRTHVEKMLVLAWSEGEVFVPLMSKGHLSGICVWPVEKLLVLTGLNWIGAAPKFLKYSWSDHYCGDICQKRYV